MKVETCSNFGRVIGKLEQAYIYQNHHVVCGECYALLTGEKTHTATPQNKEKLIIDNIHSGYVTTQRTAKKWKALMIIGVLIILTSIPLTVFLPKIGLTMCIGGVGILLFARIMVWWHHG
jgi:hypothetical protein